MNPGSRSALEFFLLDGVCDHVSHIEGDCDNLVDTITVVYNTIAQIAGDYEDHLTIRTKTPVDVATFLKEREHNLTVFTTLCSMHVKNSPQLTLS